MEFDIAAMPGTPLPAPLVDWPAITLLEPSYSAGQTGQGTRFEQLKDSGDLLVSGVYFEPTPSTAPEAIFFTGSREPTAVKHRAAGESAPNSQSVDELADERLRLLAMKYVGDSVQREVLARLQILGARLLERAPTVTPEQVAFLEQANSELETIRARHEARARRLGLPAQR